MRKRDRPLRLEEYGDKRVYDFSTRESREATGGWLFEAARDARTVQENRWVKYNDYYNFLHGATGEMRDAIREVGIDWDPSVIPDPFIQVESQIDPTVPEPEFRGRDDDQDSKKAKVREYAVRYVLQENRIEDANTANERRLIKLGDAFWKAYWDPRMECGPYEGNIRVIDVPVEAVYVDPAAGADDLEGAQYICYVYRVHKVRFWQMYNRPLRKLGVTIEDVMGTSYLGDEGIFDLVSGTRAFEDTVQVMELWYRQPYDTKEAPEGSIACSVQAGGKEVHYIPNYWVSTGRGLNQRWPFIHYWRIKDETGFYNKSELEPIIGLTDAADRALATGQLNDAMTANDILLIERGALAPGEEITNVPGSTVEVNSGKINGVRRLGGLGTGVNCIPMVNFALEQIQRTARNYDSNMGRETARVTTASGLSQLRGDADEQNKIKKADRNRGFARLFELLDALCLEFFDDGRMLFIGAEKPEDQVSIQYDGSMFGQDVPELRDIETNEVVREAYRYWPRVDVTVNAGDGVIRGKMASLEVLDKVANIPVTADNWRILAAELEILDIPQKQEIVEMWRSRFEVSQAPREPMVDLPGGGAADTTMTLSPQIAVPMPGGMM